MLTLSRLRVKVLIGFMTQNKLSKSSSRSMQICVLSGGAGSRLWPISRELMPKQFYDLANSGKPLLVDTLDRMKGLGELSVLTNQNLLFATKGLLHRFHIDAQVLGEPLRKNTAAAVALFTHLVLQKSSEDNLIGIFPSDHLIGKRDNFEKAVNLACEEAARGAVVTCGIQPTFPSDAYGYIELDSKYSVSPNELSAASVLSFYEKPSVMKAEKFISSGKFVWNAGMFIFRADIMRGHFEKHMPELWRSIATIKKDLSNIAEIFETLPSESIDYGVMEKITGIRCVVADLGWSDIGSWEEVGTHYKAQKRPIEVAGQNNSFLHFGGRSKEIAFVGVSDLEVVATTDALLVMRKGEGQRIREVVKALKSSNPQITESHTFEERPWGRFEVLEDTTYFKSKRITVWPGHRLSYQSHKHRAEHWVIVKGEAEVTLNDEIIKLKAGEHVHIPLGAKHRIANFAKEVMEFIEVQTGTYFGEDDIVRYSDEYGRT